jgi:hypothetical protein
VTQCPLHYLSWSSNDEIVTNSIFKGKKLLTAFVLEVFPYNLVAQQGADIGDLAGCLRFVGITGFESRRVHKCLSVVSTLCSLVDVSATVRSLFQSNPTVCVCVCVSVRAISCHNNSLHLQRVGTLESDSESKVFPSARFVLYAVCQQ